MSQGGAPRPKTDMLDAMNITNISENGQEGGVINTSIGREWLVLISWIKILRAREGKHFFLMKSLAPESQWRPVHRVQMDPASDYATDSLSNPRQMSWFVWTAGSPVIRGRIPNSSACQEGQEAGAGCGAQEALNSWQPLLESLWPASLSWSTVEQHRKRRPGNRFQLGIFRAATLAATICGEESMFVPCRNLKICNSLCLFFFLFPNE